MNLIKKILKILKVLYNSEYNEDGLITWHINSFTKDKLFINSYNKAYDRKSWKCHNRWRIHIALWAAYKTKDLKGDFVECGVNKGGMVEGIIDYINFENLNKKFYLIDTFEGIPSNTITNQERESGIYEKQFEDVYFEVKKHFEKYKKIEIIKGIVPSVLENIKFDKISFLSLDMNVPNVEIKAAEFFWEKIVEGGIILLDDYCYSKKYLLTNKLFDDFANKKSVKVLQLPTGQGIIIK